MRTFLATIAGLAVSFCLILLLEMLSMNLFPIKQKIDPKNLAELRRAMHLIPVPALISVIVAHFLGMILGSYVTYRIQPKSITPFLLLALFLLISTIMNLAIPHPKWFMIADIGAVVLAILLAWRLFYAKR